jgi:hypothetical protein
LVVVRGAAGPAIRRGELRRRRAEHMMGVQRTLQQWDRARGRVARQA